MRRSHVVLLATLLLGGGVALVGATSVDAKPRKAAHAQKANPAKGKKGKGQKEQAAEPAPAASGSAEPGPETPPPPTRVAGATAPVADAGANVVGVTEQGDSGVKVYKFGAQEVEGRLKSPQIIYFLRRVRAEFAAGDLGHRSFMRELSDTRRDPAFR